MTTYSRQVAHTTVDRLLELIAAGRGGDTGQLYATDAVLDATVPTWRFKKCGGPAIAAVWSGWFAEPGTFEELDRSPIPGGEVIRYLVAGVDDGTPFAAHHCHIVTVDEHTGLIVRQHTWCGGRWYPDRLQEMAEAQRREPGF
jgi:hypothetical protein